MDGLRGILPNNSEVGFKIGRIGGDLFFHVSHFSHPSLRLRMPLIGGGCYPALYKIGAELFELLPETQNEQLTLFPYSVSAYKPRNLTGFSILCSDDYSPGYDSLTLFLTKETKEAIILGQISHLGIDESSIVHHSNDCTQNFIAFKKTNDFEELSQKILEFHLTVKRENVKHSSYPYAQRLFNLLRSKNSATAGVGELKQ